MKFGVVDVNNLKRVRSPVWNAWGSKDIEHVRNIVGPGNSGDVETGNEDDESAVPDLLPSSGIREDDEDVDKGDDDRCDGEQEEEKSQVKLFC